jgi:hypothetical protein
LSANAPPVEQTKECRASDQHHRTVWRRHELDSSDVAVGETIGRVVSVDGSHNTALVGVGAGRVVARVDGGGSI